MISGKNLKRIIKESGLTQQEFADKIGKSRATIITWLGKGQLDEEAVALIREKINIDFSLDDNDQSNMHTKEIELLNEIISDLRERVDELKKDKARLQDRLDEYEGKSKSRTA